MPSPETLLDKMFAAARELRDARNAVVECDDRKTLMLGIESVVGTCMEASAGDEDAMFRLATLADVLGSLPSEEAATQLVRILGHDDPMVRTSAGEMLVHLLYDRYGEVCRVFEREVERGGNATALAEIPYLLSEVGEPGGTKIVMRLLNHADGDVVCAAIDALAAFGDPSAIPALRRLADDKRMVAVDPESDEEAPLGTLASEAIEHLQAVQKLA